MAGLGEKLYWEQMANDGALGQPSVKLPASTLMGALGGSGGYSVENPNAPQRDIVSEESEKKEGAPKSVLDLSQQLVAEKQGEQKSPSVIPSFDTSLNDMTFMPGSADASTYSNGSSNTTQRLNNQAIANGEKVELPPEYGPGYQFVMDEWARRQAETEEMERENERRNRGLRANQYVAGIGDMLASIANLMYVGRGAKNGGLGARNQVQTYGLPLQTQMIMQDRARRQSELENMRNRLNQTKQKVFTAMTQSESARQRNELERLKQDALNYRAELNSANSAERNRISSERLAYDQAKQNYMENVYHPAQNQLGWARVNKTASSGNRGPTYNQRMTYAKSHIQELKDLVKAKYPGQYIDDMKAEDIISKWGGEFPEWSDRYDPGSPYDDSPSGRRSSSSGGGSSSSSSNGGKKKSLPGAASGQGGQSSGKKKLPTA